MCGAVHESPLLLALPSSPPPPSPVPGEKGRGEGLEQKYMQLFLHTVLLKRDHAGQRLCHCGPGAHPWSSASTCQFCPRPFVRVGAYVSFFLMTFRIQVLDGPRRVGGPPGPDRSWWARSCYPPWPGQTSRRFVRPPSAR